MKAIQFIVAILGIHASTAFADNLLASSAKEHLLGLLHNFESWLDGRASERRQKDREHARVVPIGAKPEVSIRRSGIGSAKYPYFADGILFNGQRITIDDPPSRALEVFGYDFRTYQNHYIWDQLGIEMYTYAPGYGPKPYTKVIHTISIHLNPITEEGIRKPTKPKRGFTGYLDLDAAGINHDSKIWEIRALADRTGLAGANPYIICEVSRPICKIEHYGRERSDEVYFLTDIDHDNGKIYSVNYTFK